MSIIDHTETKLELLEKIKARFSNATSRNVNNLERAVHESYYLLWRNKDLAPQEIMDSFGTKASTIFLVSLKTQEFIKVINPDYTSLVTPYEYTINVDGTVTVGEELFTEDSGE